MPDRDLPDDLALPLTSGEPWWYWSGGRPAVDFANTLRERWRRNVETLVTQDDLAAFIHAIQAAEVREALRVVVVYPRVPASAIDGLKESVTTVTARVGHLGDEAWARDLLGKVAARLERDRPRPSPPPEPGPDAAP